VFSVAIATVALVAGLLLIRPALRDVATLQILGSTDIEACAASPASWGGRNGAASVYAYDPSGLSENPAAAPIEPTLLERAMRGEVARSEEGDRVTSVIKVSDSGPCAVIQGTGKRPNFALMRPFFSVLALSSALGMLLAGAGTFWFVVLPFRRRVEALSEHAGTVGTTEFARRERDSDALGHIANVLAASHTRILETRLALEQRNRALEDHLAGIAHDLRTPLASMQLALEVLANETDEPLREESRRALADAVYLGSLVENLHLGTRLRHDVGEDDVLFDLVELVARLEKRFVILGRHADIEVAASVPEQSIGVRCAPILAERAIANLIQNAIEHNAAPGHVAILLTVDEAGSRFELRVEDDGPGLPDEVVARLDHESFLVDLARQRGPGLGMLISAEVARRAGWSLRYEQLEPTGVRARLTGPVEAD
jgi:signal transduction histidine kinase